MRCIVFLVCLLTVLVPTFAAEKPRLVSKHYTVFYPHKDYEQMAGQVLEVAERIWPTLARAYGSYEHYEPITISITDEGDHANGYAIYTVSQVTIYAPHINMALRGRRNWIGNVVTHELAHVFSLRRAARLSPVDGVMVGGSTVNREFNWSASFPLFYPLVAPSWYVEGIAQLEAEAHSYDSWDSQRDMVLRDGFLTGTMPTLGEIETFDADDWVDFEKVYNTGYGFLRYLRDRYGLEKVRNLAFPKPYNNFTHSALKVFGRSLSELYSDWQASLSETYGRYRSFPKEDLYLSTGSSDAHITFSPDGRYEAWIGNDGRDFSMNWVFWRDRKTGEIRRSGKPASIFAAPSSDTEPTEPSEPTEPAEALPNRGQSGFSRLASTLMPPLPGKVGLRTGPQQLAAPVTGQSEETGHCAGHGFRWDFGNEGLDWSPDGKRLVTARTAPYSGFFDIWEYEPGKDTWHQRTWQIRATSPSYHPTGGGIVFAMQGKGNGNLAFLKPDGNVALLTRFSEGQQVYNPRFSPDGRWIYFTLGIGDREGIARMRAASMGYDPFAALGDSASFPDSVNMDAATGIEWITPLDNSFERDLFFSGDTLFWSSQREGIYDIYALLPTDSAIYRATRVRGQALQGALQGGTLYYQGFRAQRFNIHRTRLQLEPTRYSLTPGDSLARFHGESRDYAKAFAGERPLAGRVLWQLWPYLIFAPRFASDTSLVPDLALGANLMIGTRNTFLPLHQIGAEISVYNQEGTRPNYSLTYQGVLTGPAIRHHRDILAWQPRLEYGLSTEVVHQQVRITSVDTGFSPAVGFFAEEEKATLSYQQHRDQISGFLPLPRPSFHPGFGWGLFGRWWRNRMDLDYAAQLRYYRLTDSQELQRDEFTGSLFSDATFHRHYTAGLGLMLGEQKLGVLRPTYLHGTASIQKYWTRFLVDYLPLDSLASQIAYTRGEAPGLYYVLTEDFEPWQANLGLSGAYSYKSDFTLSFSSILGAYLESFPSDTLPATVSPGDTIGVRVPATQLWPLTYRLSHGRMPGYPYSVFYRGRDIMEGTSIAWGRVNLELPLKLRSFYDYLPFFTSVNQIQLTITANGGTVLSLPPDRLPDALRDRQHEFLMDVGARFSMTFLNRHQIPLTAYFQVFRPMHSLDPARMVPEDYQNAGFGSAEAYLDFIETERYYVGLDLGIF